ncbi:MAG: CRTAC1 family protein [Planctomycetaceae bacterium]
MADTDNDGFPDLLVTGYGGLLLFHNQGDGTFVETTATAGLSDRLWSSSAAWGDVNNDGLTDLYVAHYVDWSWDNHPKCPGPTPGEHDVCPPKQFEPLPDSLYLNNGDGTFRDATATSGLRRDGKGLGVLLADLDANNTLDIYVTNDTTPNFLYRNQGAASFQELGLVSGTGLGDRGNPDGSMGVELCDFDRDGQPDLWVANYERESFALYQNLGDLSFRHVSRVRGIMAVGGLYVGWGTCVADFDRDGDEDIFVANGHVIRYPTNSTFQQQPLLFENIGSQGFRNVAAIAGDYMSANHAGRGAIAADFDNDGDLDLGVSHINEPIELLVNKTDNTNHWLAMRLVGTKSARDAVGARVTIRTAHGTQTRYTHGGGSYASAKDPRLYFGLAGDDHVKSVEVDWLSGLRTQIENVSADVELLLIESPQVNH